MKKIYRRTKNELIKMAFNFGEDLMPDCTDINSRIFPSVQKWKYGIRKIARMLMDMMECSGFCCDRRKAWVACLFL